MNEAAKGISQAKKPYGSVTEFGDIMGYLTILSHSRGYHKVYI